MYFVSQPIVTNGLILNLDAGNTLSYTSGSSTWRDLLGTNNGTLTNNPVYSTRNGGLFTFGGSNYIDVNNSAGNGANVSLEAWFSTTTTTAASHLIAKAGVGNQYQYALRFGFSDPSSITVVAWQAGSSNYSSAGSSGVVVNNGNWYHVVGIIIEGTGTFIYINGVLSGVDLTTTGTYNKNGTGLLQIASRADGGGNYRGNISNVKIYNRALSATEVLQNFNALKGRYGL